MNKYIIKLSEDYNYLINHIIVTTLVEKGSNNFKCKSYQKSLREIVLITNKVLKEQIYEHKYPNKTLKYKVIKDVIESSTFSIDQEVTIAGKVSYSFIPWGTKKSICPIDIKTGKVLYMDKLLGFLSKNLGLKNIKILEIVPEGKSILEDESILYDKFSIKIQGNIENLDVFNESQFNSIGKKKSYGLGAFNLINENSL